MSDWKSRAKKVDDAPESDWRSRAKPVESIPEAPPVALPVEESGPGAFSPTSKSGAALSGLGQGASLGFLDELAGLGGAYAAATGDIGARLFGMSPEQRAELKYLLTGAKPDQSAYAAVRDSMRADDRAGAAEHPYIHGAAALAGGLTTPVPLKGGVGVKVGGATLKPWAGRALVGAGLGAASGTGTSEGESALDVAGDATGSAIIGGVAAPVVGAATDKLGGGFSRWLKKKAEENALKAIGLRAGISNQLTKRGYESADEARELGRAALDMELIRPGKTASDVLERAGFAKDVQGARIQGALASADNAGVPFDTQRAAWQAAGEAMGPEGLSPTAIREATRARKLVDDIVRLPQAQNPSFSNANQMKSDMYSGINFATDPALKTSLERKAASGLRKSIEEQVAETAGPDVADELRAANRAYGFLSDIEPMAQDEATRQQARKTMTALDWASVLGGGASIGAVGGTGAGILSGAGILGSKLLGPRIPSTFAVTQNAMGQALPGMSRALEAPTIKALTSETSPVASQNAYDALMQRFGIKAKSKEELADEAFLKGQSDPSMQTGR